jgi:DNA-binding CsgD family transcriptional regulator
LCHAKALFDLLVRFLSDYALPRLSSRRQGTAMFKKAEPEGDRQKPARRLPGSSKQSMGSDMNDRLPAPLRAPTPFSTPRPDDRVQLRSPSPINPAHSPADQPRPAGDKTLAQLAQESFEAGFAAGASNVLSDPSTQSLSTPQARSQSTASDSKITDLVRALTPRRLEVLKLVARGLTNPEIASVLGLSANTIKAHMTGILETLEVTNRTEAAIALQDFEAEG